MSFRTTPYARTSISLISYSLTWMQKIIITQHHEEAKWCYQDRILPLSVPDLPIPTRTLNSSIRPELLNPIVFKPKRPKEYSKQKRA